MTSAAQNILEQALTLAHEERAEIASALVESLDPGMDEKVEAAWRTEIRQRLAKIDSGEAEWVPWEKVLVRFHSEPHGDGAQLLGMPTGG